MVAMDQITEFARRVADEFKPHKIILFGSYAGGRPNADSDVDLLIVMPYEGKSWHTATAIRGRVRAGFPLDLMVRSSDEVEERLTWGDPFFQEITDEGRVLYESTDP